jgi:predicted nucleic acid-binding protein
MLNEIKLYVPKIIQNEFKNEYIFLPKMYHRSVFLPIFHILNLIILSIKKQTNGNIINHYMKIKMLFHIILHYCCRGEHTLIYYTLHLLIGHFIF